VCEEEDDILGFGFDRLKFDLDEEGICGIAEGEEDEAEGVSVFVVRWCCA